MKCKIEYIKLNGTDITPSPGFQDLGKCSTISETLDLIGQVAPMTLSKNLHRDSSGLILKYRPEIVEYSCTVVPDLDPRELSIKLTIEVKERYDEGYVPVQLSCLWSFTGDDTFCRSTFLNATFSPFNRDVLVSVEDDDPSDSWLTHRSEVDYFIVPALRMLCGNDPGVIGAGITVAGTRYILPRTTLKASSCSLLDGLYKYYNPGYPALRGISEIRRCIEPSYDRLYIKFCSCGDGLELGESYFGPDLSFVFSAFFQIGLLLSKGDVFLLRLAKEGEFSDPKVYDMLVSDLTELSQDLGIPVYLEQL